MEKNWFLKSINTPNISITQQSNKKIIIAIVDDGMRISHQAIKEFIWVNPHEIAENSIDDDGNGMVDDIYGWDVSDNDNIVFPPPSDLIKFYHGTHLAAIISQITSASLGESASKYIRIMPVKTISNRTSDTYLKDAYKGIEYAVDAGADIILTAWGLSHISSHEERILEKAKNKGVIVIASAGNLPEEKKQYPAAFPSVIAVSALNQYNQKIKQSNFGQFVSLSAPGIDIYSALAHSDTSYGYKQGSSFSAAMTAAAAALIKLKHPDYNANQVEACLINSTDILDKIKPIYSGKLGSGKLNVQAAVNCAIFTMNNIQSNKLVKPRGTIIIKPTSEKKQSWLLSPPGEFKGIRFSIADLKGNIGGSKLSFFTAKGEDRKMIGSYNLATIPENFYIPITPVYMTLENHKKTLKLEGSIKYAIETIDFTKKYCKDIIYLYEEGVIEDGSKDNNYAYHSNCKWLITAPEGKVVKISFTEFDTEIKTDLIYFFDGAGTHEKIMAIFSGEKIPPELITWNNQVLIWFVSDDKNQGKGWKASFKFQ